MPSVMKYAGLDFTNYEISMWEESLCDTLMNLYCWAPLRNIIYFDLPNTVVL